MLLAKFKWGILLLLTKGKALLLGLTQVKTLLSMGIAIWVYTVVLRLEVRAGVDPLHLRPRDGARRRASALRDPGDGADVHPGLRRARQLKQDPATVAEDARTGLAGPIWGAAAAIAALALGAVLHSQLLFAIAQLGAWINLFNLLPVWQLDGGRGFAALSRAQRGIVAGRALGVGALGADGLLFLLAIAATFRAASRGNAPPTGDRPVLATYLALAIGLAGLMAVAHIGAGDLPRPGPGALLR